MTEYQIDPVVWFGKRELKFFPNHFVPTGTPLSEESRTWLYTKTFGRYCIQHFSGKDYPAFENPAEAVLYELTWS